MPKKSNAIEGKSIEAEKKPAVKSQFLPPTLHGIAIDITFIVLNLFLMRFFSARLGTLFDESFGDNEQAFFGIALLMFFILGFRLIGLYLKRFPLQARLQNSGDANIGAYFWIFNLPIILLTSAFTVTLFVGVLQKSGFITKKDIDSPLTMALAIIVLLGSAALEFYFLVRLAKPLSAKEKDMLAEKNPLFGFWFELLADFGLFAYMMVWQVFYFQTITLFTENSLKSVEFFIVTLIFSLIIFFLFYLSPRTVFLIEDRRYKSVWLTISLVFLSSFLPTFIF